MHNWLGAQNTVGDRRTTTNRLTWFSWLRSREGIAGGRRLEAASRVCVALALWQSDDASDRRRSVFRRLMTTDDRGRPIEDARWRLKTVVARCLTPDDARWQRCLDRRWRRVSPVWKGHRKVREEEQGWSRCALLEWMMSATFGNRWTSDA